MPLNNMPFTIEDARNRTARDVAAINALGSIRTAGVHAGASNYRTDKEYKQFLKQLEWSKQQDALARAERGANTARRVGFLTNSLKDWAHQPGGFLTSGGSLSPLSSSGVFSEGQIQENINKDRAMVDASVDNQQTNIRNEMGGRGFGANSPLSIALQQGAWNTGLAAKADVGRQYRWDASQKMAELQNQRDIASMHNATQIAAINQRAHSEAASRRSAIWQALGNV